MPDISVATQTRHGSDSNDGAFDYNDVVKNHLHDMKCPDSNV